MRTDLISDRLPVTRGQLERLAALVALPSADIQLVELDGGYVQVHTVFGGRPYTFQKAVIA